MADRSALSEVVAHALSRAVGLTPAKAPEVTALRHAAALFKEDAPRALGHTFYALSLLAATTAGGTQRVATVREAADGLLPSNRSP